MIEPYETEFAPCPLCGSDDIVEAHDSSSPDPEWCEWELECMDCGVSMGSGTLRGNPKVELIEKWNRRPEESTELNKLMDMVNQRDRLLTELSNELLHWNAVAMSRVDLVAIMKMKQGKKSFLPEKTP